ncbi:MAG: cupin domain-containing protein, partial [Halobacteria archaeon]|nr:cupin domain-containing protein [Halobacteria archaeon]
MERGEPRRERVPIQGTFECRGYRQIGFSLYEIPPGKRSCPYHYHTANEEAIFVLEGEGTLRYSDGEADLNPGDFAAFPADEEGGHQVVNDSDATLRYVMVSTMEEPDVIVYPETDKFG